MSHYTQLAREERHQIYALMKAGHNQSKIAGILGRNKSTISREITRNRGLKGYRPKQADTFATNRHHGKTGSRIPNTTWDRVEELLKVKWSPEQISNWLKNEENINISHEWIYQHILQNKREGGATSTCVAKNNAGNAMGAQTTAVGRSRTASPSMNDPQSSMTVVALGTGRLTQL